MNQGAQLMRLERVNGHNVHIKAVRIYGLGPFAHNGYANGRLVNSFGNYYYSVTSNCVSMSRRPHAQACQHTLNLRSWSTFLMATISDVSHRRAYRTRDRDDVNTRWIIVYG